MGTLTVESPPAPRVWRIALVIAFGAFMSQLDTSVVNVGLRTIADDLGAGIDKAQWVANGYLLALAVSLPACGWLCRRFGAVEVWTTSLAAFTVTSVLCGLAGTLSWLIALRGLQGLAAGLLIPAGQTVLGQAVGPGRLGRVMSTVGIALTLAPTLGPSFGGLLLHLASWPWLFWINLPLGLAGLVLAWRYLPRGRAALGEAGRLDWFGLLLVSVGVPALVYGFTEWGERGSPASPVVAAALGVGVVGLTGFLAWALRRPAPGRPRPVLDVRLFRVPRYAAAAVTVAAGGAALFGATLLFPLYFQLGRGESALATGVLLITMSIGNAVALPLAGWLVDRYGGGIVSLVGGLVTIATTVPFALLPLSVGEPVVQALLLVRGAALAAVLMPATTAGYQAVTAAQLPDAATQMNILMRVSGALGGALFTVVLTGALALGDPRSAFHASFWWLTGASVFGLVGALWLTLTERVGGTASAAP